MSKFFPVVWLALLFGITNFTQAQELHQDLQGIWQAQVERVVSEEKRAILGTEVTHIFQILEVRILEGEREGQVITVENDFIKLEKDDRLFLSYLITISGEEIYSIYDVDRRASLFWLIGLFCFSIILISGKQGLRSIFSLGASIFVIVYALIPALLAGYPPILTSVTLASIILFCAIFITHGFNRESAIALGGTVSSVALTGFLAYFGVEMAQLTGFASDEAIYLNFNNPGLNFQGLLLGGIIIGILGVLDDVSITQASVVSELYASNPQMERAEAYQRASRVGREHVGALVNTLALAYTGAALPLLLLFSTSEASVSSIINREIFATEIVRTIIGSIGLIMAVPITTLLAVIFLKNHGRKSEHHHHH